MSVDIGFRIYPVYWYFCVGAIIWLLTPFTVVAHSGGTPQLAGEPAGPYRVYAWTSPDPWRVGDAHIDIAIAKPGEQGIETPVMDADVRLELTHAESGTNLTMTADPLVFLNSFYYETDFSLPAAGTWEITVRVNAPDGEGMTGFTVEALGRREINWLLLGGGVLALLGAAGLSIIWSRRNPPARQPARKPHADRTRLIA